MAPMKNDKQTQPGVKANHFCLLPLYLEVRDGNQKTAKKHLGSMKQPPLGSLYHQTLVEHWHVFALFVLPIHVRN